MTPAALRATALQWLAEARPAVVVEVAHTRGSVPREAGTRMLVAADTVHGTIGGGHLELKAIAGARRLLAGLDEPAEQHFPLGPALGQCCGGAVTLWLRPLATLQGEHRPEHWPLPPPCFALQLYGAGHVGRAIVRLLEDLPCRVWWIDEREDEFPPAPALPVPHIERVCVEPVEAEVASAPPGCSFLVLTHSHDLDLAITEAVLRRGDFGFLGLIGSATKRARFTHRFEARGIAPERIARMVCPIGLPGIAGKEPEVIALAAVAQLLQQAAGVEGSPRPSHREAR
ncbi:xanthine dehydrogenase accessory protein XdhC [Pseudorhodoferax sp.]|uniref:xanthine dehydrogenase accessory protein XdhC n=1 Tax=Pseudorhodoferax sp. TaxID=1993553 RepID=UPI002DD6A66F|nr:xanthine dehydrogenase accessory protein XdhC [Pseudorhodoferax sp.]